MMKRLLYILLMALMVVSFANTLVSCSAGDVKTSPSAAKMQNGFYVYENIDFNCQAPGYDAGTTRAVTYNWQLGQTLFARFKSGLSYYLGFITRTDTGWTLISTNDFLSLTTSGTCELFYFLDANGDYYYVNVSTGYLEIYNNGSYVRSTDIPWNSKSISLSEETAVYVSTANYSTTTNSFKLETVLEPMMWRMRFSGTNGTSITLPGSDNDIQYCSAFNWSTSSTSFSMAVKDVSLKVSNGYTPYIYGEFVNANASNKITVENANETYTRNLNASSLPVGTSGYFDIPTESDYSSKGWTKGGEESWKPIFIGTYVYGAKSYASDGSLFYDQVYTDEGLTLFQSDSNPNRYRIAPLWASEDGMDFLLNEDGTIVVQDVPTGHESQKYGPISVSDIKTYGAADLDSYYENGVFYFNLAYHVPEGVFAYVQDTFTLTAKAKAAFMAHGNVSSSAPVWMQKAPKSTAREETILKADLEKTMEEHSVVSSESIIN